jgi:hypothetical protein
MEDVRARRREGHFGDVWRQVPDIQYNLSTRLVVAVLRVSVI